MAVPESPHGADRPLSGGTFSADSAAGPVARDRGHPTAASAATAIAAHAATNGALTPIPPINTPLSAEPADSPTISAAATQVNASVSEPGVTARPTSAYWQENTGAIVTPARKLATIPSGIVRANTSGTTHATAAVSSQR